MKRDASGEHKYLKISPVHHGEDAARRTIKRALAQLHIKHSHIDWLRGELSIQNKITKLSDLVQETKEYGIPKILYAWIEAADPFFPPGLEIASTGSGISFAIDYGDFSRQVRAPGRMAPLEQDLTDDIIFYRRAVCESSGDTHFREAARHYRGYLQTSISIIDAFINRYVQVIKHTDPSRLPAGLDEQRALADRIELWVEGIANQDPALVRRGAEWNHFLELKNERNRLVHAADPYHGISLREIPRFLNAVRTGIGGLLLKLRELAGQGTLGFIERLRTAPEVSFRDRK